MSLPALKSKVVRDEWLYARKQGKRVIPVVVDEIWDHPEVKTGTFIIPNWMHRSHWSDFRATESEPQEAWKNFVKALNEFYPTRRFINLSAAMELPSHYVSRTDEIDTAIRGLIDYNDDAVSMRMALSGAGGYGKTTLAVAITHDEKVQQGFDDGILWIELGEKLQRLSDDARSNRLISIIRELIDALTGEKPEIASLVMARTKLQEAISDLYILVVIDDVWDISHLTPFLVKTTHSSCLITTRSLDTVSQKDILKQTIDRMKPIEAVKLLGTGFDSNEAQQNAVALQSLARGLREYPLVLALANTQIHRNMQTGRPLTLAISSAQNVLEKRGILGFDDKNPIERQRAVSATLDVSINQLDPETRRRLYRELAIFPEDVGIPLVILEKYWKLDAIDTDDFCKSLYLHAALLHSFNWPEVRVHDVFRDCLTRYYSLTQAQALHRRLTDSWGVKSGATITTLPDAYAWKNLAYHMIEGGQPDLLRALLLDYRYLHAKLTATDTNTLLDDCDALLKLGKDETIRQLRSAISIYVGACATRRRGHTRSSISRTNDEPPQK